MYVIPFIKLVVVKLNKWVTVDYWKVVEVSHIISEGSYCETMYILRSQTNSDLETAI